MRSLLIATTLGLLAIFSAAAPSSPVPQHTQSIHHHSHNLRAHGHGSHHAIKTDDAAANLHLTRSADPEESPGRLSPESVTISQGTIDLMRREVIVLEKSREESVQETRGDDDENCAADERRPKSFRSHVAWHKARARERAARAH